MALVKLLPQLRPRSRRSKRGAGSEPAAFLLGTIDELTIRQIDCNNICGRSSSWGGECHIGSAPFRAYVPKQKPETRPRPQAGA